MMFHDARKIQFLAWTDNMVPNYGAYDVTHLPIAW